MSTSTAPRIESGPLSQLRTGRLPRRLSQLALGLALYGASLALMVRGSLGLAPWDVLHAGVTLHLPLSFGQAVIAVSLVVLLLWIPLRERPGVGTLANALLVGLCADATLALLDTPQHWGLRWGLMLGGVVLNGVATGMYIGAGLGRGPRDGLMTGLVRRTGRSVRLVRTSIELVVVAIGFALGGSLGVTTVVYAFGIGPLAHLTIPWFRVETQAPASA